MTRPNGCVALVINLPQTDLAHILRSDAPWATVRVTAARKDHAHWPHDRVGHAGSPRLVRIALPAPSIGKITRRK
ncbi:hypothetical protein OKW49_002210 [Paraburkholderia youngii]